MPATESDAPIDREALREITRRWSDHERRLLVERVLEQPSDDELERLLMGLVHLKGVRRDRCTAPSLDHRITEHVAATKRGDFLGELTLRNAHGEREPWETQAWIAATSHLFDLALARGQTSGGDDSLRALVRLVEEVDDRIDELVTFEDTNAHGQLGHSLQLTRAQLSQH